MLIYCSGTSILAKTQVTADISLASFNGEPSEWEKTDEARQLFECTPNVTGPRRLVPEAIELPKRGVREAFMKLFTTSTMGLGAATGAGKRDGKVQSNFRAQLLKDYESVDPVTGFIWCPILQEAPWTQHLARKGLRGSSRIELMICSAVEKYFDSGVVAVVPDFRKRPTSQVWYGWLNREIRDFKTRIIDTEWGLDRPVYMALGVKWRELDNRKLKFLGPYQPAARYLYFHYCVQILRRAWKAGPGQTAGFALKDEHGKSFWGTPGRYLAKNMPKAFVVELGHGYHDLLAGAHIMDNVPPS